MANDSQLQKLWDSLQAEVRRLKEQPKRDCSTREGEAMPRRT